MSLEYQIELLSSREIRSVRLTKNMRENTTALIVGESESKKS